VATKRNYVAEKMRIADEIASRTSGVARSQEEYDAQKKAWEEAFDAQKRSEQVGAGRGLVNPPLINSRAQYNAEKAAGDPYATSMSFEEWKNLD
jgi:hypothetical protein